MLLSLHPIDKEVKTMNLRKQQVAVSYGKNHEIVIVTVNDNPYTKGDTTEKGWEQLTDYVKEQEKQYEE
jgi:hypothetical protein